MIKALIRALLLVVSLSGCGYDGWVRYECQEYENWTKPQCVEPECKATGTCSKDLVTIDD